MKRYRAKNAAAWVVFAVLAALIFTLFFGLGLVSGQNTEDQRTYVKQAIERAAVQCYALEGAYPPDVRYLEEHYGIKYDSQRFFVHYRVYGSNIRPEIEVFTNEPSAGGFESLTEE